MLNILTTALSEKGIALEITVSDKVSTYLVGDVMRVRQITGQLARRIVCRANTGDSYQRGEQFGMIKLGSRTELILPREEGLELVVEIGTKVQAGSSIMARYVDEGVGGQHQADNKRA